MPTTPETPSSPHAQPFDVIAVGAHPDDVEIGCGGTLARLVRLGYRVGIIDLTDGEPTPHSPGPHVRLAEARMAAEILGVHARETLPLPNRRLFDTFEARVALARQFRRYRPKVVISMEGRTPLASPDHFQAMLLTEAAVFYSRLTKWEEHFGELAPHSIAAMASYSLDLAHTFPADAGQFLSDISDTFETKVAAVRAYATQFPSAKEAFFPRLQAVNASWGEIAGFRYGELLRSYRPIATSDFMSIVSPGNAK